MKVDRITAQVRYSQDTGHGAWKAIELGAEASVDGKESWTEAQASLYQQLGRQLKVLWANGNGKATGLPQDGAESTLEAPQPAEQPIQPNGSNHHCQQHGVLFKQYHRGNNSWYAHKAPDGKWCREK